MYDFHDEARDALASKEDALSMQEAFEFQDAIFSCCALVHEAGIAVVRFENSSRQSKVPDYRGDFAKLTEALPRNSKVLFDFSGVEDFHSASIEALGNLSHKLRNKGSRIVLCCLQPKVKEAFFPAKVN